MLFTASRTKISCDASYVLQLDLERGILFVELSELFLMGHLTVDCQKLVALNLSKGQSRPSLARQGDFCTLETSFFLFKEAKDVSLDGSMPLEPAVLESPHYL